MTHSHGTLSLKIKQYMSNWNFYYEKNHSWTKMPLLELTTKSEAIIGTLSNTESRRERIPLIPLPHPPVTTAVMSYETQIAGAMSPSGPPVSSQFTPMSLIGSADDPASALLNELCTHQNLTFTLTLGSDFSFSRYSCHVFTSLQPLPVAQLYSSFSFWSHWVLCFPVRMRYRWE